MGTRLNIGCGQSPTPGWLNYDNSPSVWLARWPALARLLRGARLLDAHALEFVEFCRRRDIRHADASRRIPHADASVDAIYPTESKDGTKVTYEWSEGAKVRRATNIFPPSDSKPWAIDTGRGVKTRWVEFEPVPQ